MVLILLALGGILLVVACVRYGFRWLRNVVVACLLLFLWEALEHVYPVLGWLGYIWPLVVVAWILRHRHGLRGLRSLIQRHRFEKAMRAEADETDHKSIPRVLKVEKIDD